MTLKSSSKDMNNKRKKPHLLGKKMKAPMIPRTLKIETLDFHLTTLKI